MRNYWPFNGERTMKIETAFADQKPAFRPFSLTITFGTPEEAEAFYVTHSFADINLATPACDHDGIQRQITQVLGGIPNTGMRNKALELSLKWYKENYGT
jgi:hypothetical protein